MPALVTTNMHQALAEWYQIFARHHREGTSGHLWGLSCDRSHFLARIPAKIDNFVGCKLLPGAPVGANMEKIPVFWMQMNGLELRNP